MRKIIVILLIVLLSTEVITMAKNNKPVLDGGQSAASAKNQANFKTPASGTALKKNKPAWADFEIGNGTGVNLPAAIQNAQNPQIGRPANVGYFEEAAQQETRRKAGLPSIAPMLGTSDTQYQTFGTSSYQPIAPVTQRPPAYGGSYNPTSTNTAWSPPTWLRPRQDTPDPATMVNEYVGTPVDTSLSDTLRGITPPAPTPPPFQTPVGIGFTAARPFNYRPPASGGGYGGGYSNSGFGSSYGGNWSGGGGGGGWNDYGDGYGDRPAWMNYLQNLYSWNIK